MKTQKSYKSRTIKTPIAMLLSLLLFMFLAMPAQAVVITKDFTGLWLQPDHESQGFDFQVINQNGGVTQAVVYWYTYDTAGNPMWLIGMGDVEGNQVSMDLMTVTGVTNLQDNDPQTRNEIILASASFTFDDCQNGTVDISPKPTGATVDSPNSISGTGGIVRVQRLTSIQGSSCSGGISDNTEVTESSYEVTQFMSNTGVYPDGNARIKFKQSATTTEFEVEVEDIPVGSYDLRVDGVIRGQFEVIVDGSGTEGDIEFDSPADQDEILLDFDPRDKAVEVLENGAVLFGVVFTPESIVNPDPVSSGAPPFANDVETEMVMNNTGLIQSAKGEVKLDQEMTEVEFEVEIEDLPLGNYGLFVDGALVGTITVENDEGGAEGEIEFSFPEEAGNSILDFDPRGKLIEVRQGDVGTILQVNF